MSKRPLAASLLIGHAAARVALAALLVLAAVALLARPARAAPPLAGETPTGGSRGAVRVVSPEERRTFYRTGGREALDRAIHLHVEAEILRKEPEPFVDRAGTRWLRFENRGVALLVAARSPEWLQVRRHLTDAQEFCLHGRVRLMPGDERERPIVEVATVARAPGSWR